MEPSQAVAATLFYWLCEAHSVVLSVAAVAGNQAGRRTEDSQGGTQVSHIGQTSAQGVKADRSAFA